MTGRIIGSANELVEACGHGDFQSLTVTTVIEDLPTLRLARGQKLQGAPGAALHFNAGVDGLELSGDNEVIDLRIVTDPDRRALFNGETPGGFGRLTCRGLRVTGCIRIVLKGRGGAGHVDAHDVAIEYADATAFDDRPKGYGVEVVPGVFTIWNQQDDPTTRVTCDVGGISVGRAGAPVRGSGVFIAGTPGGGRLFARRVETGEIHSDGGISVGTANRISGGVFVVHGAWVDDVRNLEPVTTYGPNDMVLDNWGTVRRWRADAKITSHGPSAIGFVNFGDLEELRVDDAIETHGQGARGFNVYAGTLRSAEFDRIVTRGDGAVGVQISKPVGRILVQRGIETFGGRGPSLVKGVITDLPAIALSVKPGGTAREIVVHGGLRTHGEGIEAFELHGDVDEFTVRGGFGPDVAGFQTI